MVDSEGIVSEGMCEGCLQIKYVGTCPFEDFHENEMNSARYDAVRKSSSSKHNEVQVALRYYVRYLQVWYCPVPSLEE